MSKKSVLDKLNEELDVAKEILEESEVIVDIPEDEPEAVQQEVLVVEKEVEKPVTQWITHQENPADDDIQNDYKQARATLKSLIFRAELTLDSLLNIAEMSEHPRAYEVATQLIKTIAEVSKDLLALQKTIKEVNREEKKEEGGLTVQNAENVTQQIVFTGTTADLQQQLKQLKDNERNS